MDINTLVERMLGDGSFARVVRNPLAQFGAKARPLYFSQLLPERLVTENSYREDKIHYRSVIANNGTRYSPVQIKNSVISGSFLVELGHSDIGSEFTSRDYDVFLGVLGRANGSADDPATMEATAMLVKWVDATLATPLAHKRELERAQAICDAKVSIVGDDGYEYEVQLADPAGHRVTADLEDWDDPDYPIYDDILAGVELLASKGYAASTILAGSPFRSKLSKNNDIKARCGKVVVDATGQLKGASGRASLEQINQMFSEDGLPSITIYDTQYHLPSGTGYFLPRTDFVIAGTTTNEETFDAGDGEPVVITGTHGYHAIGRAVGQAAPGQAIVVTPHRDKPPRIEGQAWQTDFPVPTEPEAIYRIRLEA